MYRNNGISSLITKRVRLSFGRNSGDSGAGLGGVFGLIDWVRSQGAVIAMRAQDPEGTTKRDITMHYNQDRSGGIFDAQPWFEYNSEGNHRLRYPNNRVYLVTTDNSSAMTDSSIQQPIMPCRLPTTIIILEPLATLLCARLITALPNEVQTKTIDASNDDNWVYFDLTTGQSSTDKNSTWQIGFKRNNVILNGGDWQWHS